MKTTTDILYKRSDYMDSKCSHQQYYDQFVVPRIRELVLETFGIERLTKALAADEYMNSIPIRNWDNLGRRIANLIREPLREAGDCDSNAGRVCILKAAARQIVKG